MYGIDLPGTRAPGEGPGDALALPAQVVATAAANAPRASVGAAAHPAQAVATAHANAPTAVAGAVSFPDQVIAGASVSIRGSTGAAAHPAQVAAAAYANAPRAATGAAGEPAQVQAHATANGPTSGVAVMHRYGNRQTLAAGIAVPGERAPGEAPLDEDLVIPPRARAMVNIVAGVGVFHRYGNSFVIRSGIVVPGAHVPGEAPDDDVQYFATVTARARAIAPFAQARPRRPRTTVIIS